MSAPPPEDKAFLAHIAWVIESRAATQKTALRLYQLLKEFPGAGSTDEGRALVAVAFSLWRAAFLADQADPPAAESAHAMAFLERMLVDNAIGYAQDRNARDWAFRYYLDNARTRLEELERQLVAKGRYFFSGPLEPAQWDRNPQGRWDLLQSVFDKCVKEFAVSLGRGDL
jgi:hypothetical protein